MKKNRIIAIDGPAASGKGTLAHKLAKEIGYDHLDTGALYRGVAVQAIEENLHPEDKNDAIKAAQDFIQKLENNHDSVLSNPKLKDDAVGQFASIVAAYPEIRKILVQYQRNFVQKASHGAVLDGRDIGTVICPDADIKLFVTADLEIRAKRRFKELQSHNRDVTYEAVLADMRIRDERDKSRKSSPMKMADGAIVIDTSTLDQQEALEKALLIVREQI